MNLHLVEEVQSRHNLVFFFRMAVNKKKAVSRWWNWCGNDTLLLFTTKQDNSCLSSSKWKTKELDLGLLLRMLWMSLNAIHCKLLLAKSAATGVKAIDKNSLLF